MSLARFFAAIRVARRELRSLAMRWYLRLAHPGVRCHRSVYFGPGARVRAFAGARIELGPGCHVHDGALIVAEGGSIEIGNDCLIGRGTVIVACSSIRIGAGTLIAEQVTIRDQDHAYDGEGNLAEQGNAAAPILIGHDVWLAAKVTVTKGVEIAPHVVVGANSVVTRSLVERGVYAGAPARLVRKVDAAVVEPAAQSL